MNNRARNRLIGVSAIILILVVAGYFTLAGGDNQANKTPTQVLTDATLAGQRVKVAGTVVDDSWDGKANPMRFSVRDKGKTDGPELKVSYGGVVPSSFGNKTEAILTGTLSKDGVFEATDMLTQCPSKYKSGASAESVALLLSQGSAVVDKPVKVLGYMSTDVVGGVFTLQESSTGGKTVQVAFSGTPTAETKTGSTVEVGGQLGKDGVFKATTVVVVQPGK